MALNRNELPEEPRGAPHNPVSFSEPDVDEADIAAVAGVLRKGWITSGCETEQLEEELSAYLGGARVVTMASGTAALETAAAYLGLRPGSKVGVPTWTFVSSALSFMKLGATPVLLDIVPETLNVDPEALEPALALGLDAVVVVHMAGLPVDSDVRRLCRRADTPMIEDAAHALGASDDRGRIGSSTDGATCFSFYATKNLTSGEGGALTTTDSSLASFARSFRLHGLSLDAYARHRPGRPKEYELEAGGIKGNLSDILAALARSQLRRFDAMQTRRRLLVGRYREQLQEIEGVVPLPPRANPSSADHLMLVQLPESCDRDELRARLSEDGIGTSVHFRPLHTFEWMRSKAEIGPVGVGNADAMRDRVLSLPLHSRLADDDVARVCEQLAVHVSQCVAG